MNCEVIWDGLSTAVRRCFDSEKRHGLMMSAGWDSRLLLGAMLEHLGNHKVVAYTWGNPRSHELQVANQICRSTGVECIVKPLDDSLYEPSFLERTFNRVENVLYPQWHRASEQLAEIGVQSVSAGVYGEVLGGHYGPEMALAGMRKAIVVGAALIGIPVLFNAFERLRSPGRARKPWWRDLEQLSIKNREQLIEAFMALTRGSRLINQQILSCRTDLDVALPFIDFDLLKIASQIPQSAKIHNTINRNLLQRYKASLLQFATGATLVPASMPILSQEVSRVIRLLSDNVSTKVNKFTRSRLSSRGLDFLRNGRALRTILDDLRSDIWDRNAIEQSIKNVAEHKEANMLDVHKNFLTIYTTDLMLR
jgi:asparagine synthetase B (glutamine-hydrolysing)